MFILFGIDQLKWKKGLSHFFPWICFSICCCEPEIVQLSSAVLSQGNAAEKSKPRTLYQNNDIKDLRLHRRYCWKWGLTWCFKWDLYNFQQKCQNSLFHFCLLVYYTCLSSPYVPKVSIRDYPPFWTKSGDIKTNKTLFLGLTRRVLSSSSLHPSAHSANRRKERTELKLSWQLCLQMICLW